MKKNAGIELQLTAIIFVLAAIWNGKNGVGALFLAIGGFFYFLSMFT
jgi:hypothetical protein